MKEKLASARRDLARAKLNLREAVSNGCSEEEKKKLMEVESRAKIDLRLARYEDIFERMGERNEKHKGR